MPEKILQTYKHIQCVRGVSHGMITQDVFNLLCEKYELTSEEIKILQSQLKEEEIAIITEDERNALVEKIYGKKDNSLTDGAFTSAKHAKRVVSDHRITQMAIQTILDLNWSEEKLLSTINHIRNEICSEYKRCKIHRTSAWIIASALVNIGADISLRRMEKRGERGWVCGTYTNNVTKLISSRISVKYSNNKLDLLVDYCTKEIETSDTMVLLLVCLIKDIKPILVHRSYSLTD